MKEICLVSTVRVARPDSDREVARRILSYMDEHCADAVLTQVAAAFSFHPNTVSALLLRFKGASFASALRELRMKRAAELLSVGDLPVEEIARRCGYNSCQAFRRSFRETYGMTPSAYARSFRA